MFNKIKKAIVETLVSYKKIDLIHNRELNDYKHSRINLGQIQSKLNNEKKEIKSINELEFQVFSQFGDDGIIQYLIDKLPIKNKTFIEFGVENYKEANTRFLLVNNAWSGLVIDGSIENINQIRNSQLYSFYDLRAVHSFITKDNINDIIKKSGFQEDIGILSVDIDGNDYWVLESINVVKPDIIICEYNSLFGFDDPITIPYKHDFVRGQKTPFNFYGASLKSLCLLAKTKGYFFVGCNSAGNNAYFISEKHREHSPLTEKTPEEGYNLAMFSETWDANKEPRRGKEKLMSINGLEVVDVITMETKKLDSQSIVNSLLLTHKFKGIH
jgi:hypothetical protein